MPNPKKKNAVQAEKITVHEHDVLNGRGVNIAQHPGNLRFRALVKSHADQSYCSDYSTSAKKALAEEIIHHIQNLSPPGRFLKRPSRSKKASDVDDGHWEQLSFRETLKKTCQALRDCNRFDRSEYARHIETPEDVQASHEQRQQSGLSKREYAEQIAGSLLARAPVSGPSARAKTVLHVDTSAMAAAAPEAVKSFTATSKQPTTTPATAASSTAASTSGSFHYFQDREDGGLIGGDQDHHSVSGVTPLHFSNHFTNSPMQTSGIEYDPFHLDEEQKLAAMARESANFDGDFDDGCHESAEAILGRPLEETDYTTVFDGDITI
uniref:DUF6824 domain-containing protein n=1 Tax=Amphora coffeiformis TaxID=265554 RepID=A0A7S3L9D7_9STRA|mmetsp:Transcript_20387/g.38620  ORF Transcript_20387/g.38620 Transcript_20387/m.38620 type:complete len:323 (+) Transcript_20387:341-1309(+)|eukprot:scaffold3498_cov176-Amphora_coffeaeformis.AAC.1